MKLNLQDNITSTQDLKAVILEVRKYAKWFNQTSVKMRTTGGDSYQPPAILPPAENLINECVEGQQVSQGKLDELIVVFEDFEQNGEEQRQNV